MGSRHNCLQGGGGVLNGFYCFVFWRNEVSGEGILMRDLQCPRLLSYTKMSSVPRPWSVAFSPGLIALGTDVKGHQERDNRKLFEGMKSKRGFGPLI